MFLLLGVHICLSYRESYKTMTGLYVITLGMVYGLFVCKMITCTMTHMLFNPLPWEMITLAIFYIPGLSDSARLHAAFVVSVLLYLNFTRGIILQITEYLGIYCFSVQKRQK